MKYRTRYQQTAILAIVLIVAALAGVFIRFRMQADTGRQTQQAAGSDAALSISGFEHTATRNGRTEWILQAAMARMYSEKQTAVLTDIEMKVFAADSTQIELTADEGEFHTKTRDMQVRGSVVARYPGYTLRTESLHYRHDSHILYTNEPVIVTGANSRIRADSAQFEIKTRQVSLKGDVQAWMNGNEQN